MKIQKKAEKGEKPRVGFGKVIEIPKEYEKKSPNHQPEFVPKSILKKSGTPVAEQGSLSKRGKKPKKKNVSLQVEQRAPGAGVTFPTNEKPPPVAEKKAPIQQAPQNPPPMTSSQTAATNKASSATWHLRETQFQQETRNGISTVHNPLYNPQLVQLREHLDDLRIKSARPGAEPALLDLSNKELTALPTIICKHSYLTVLNLYMNQIRSLPIEIGNPSPFSLLFYF